MTVDEAFAFLIFFISAVGHAWQLLSVPAPRNLPSKAKECSCYARGFTGLVGGGGGGCWEAWAHQRLTDALLICSSVTDTSACGRPGSSSK